MSSLFSSLILEPVARRARKLSSSPETTQQAPKQELEWSPSADILTNGQPEQSCPAPVDQASEENPFNRADQRDAIEEQSSIDSLQNEHTDFGSHENKEAESNRIADVTRVPEMAEEEVFQGLIPLSDVRGGYISEEPLLMDTALPAAHGDPMTIESASVIDGGTIRSFGSMSLDSVPPNQSSNPSHDIEGRLWPNGRRGSYDSGSNMSVDRLSRTSIEHPVSSREGSISGGSTMSGSLPADDGMKELRAKIRKIHAMALSSEDKARRMHTLMISDYKRLKAPKDMQGIYQHKSNRNSRSYHTASSASAQDGDHSYCVKPRDLIPTYHPRSPVLSPTLQEHHDLDENMTEDDQVLGCAHYMRNIKVQCVDCRRWYPCRFCHDEAEDHRLERKRIKNMLCMLCGTPQPAAETCSQCGIEPATYYCEICKLWDNDPRKRIYHCPDCGICRRGEGLGRDYFHCKRCNVCISIRWAEEHRCVERATECDCPICGEYMFTSSGDVVAVRCGHYMHKVCYKAYMDTNFRCPICGRSMVNMALQWRKLDDQIASQPMPEEFANTQAFVSCNDCAGKSCVAYHWLGLKCATCDSYNTVRLRLINAPIHEPIADADPTEVTAAAALRSEIAIGPSSASGLTAIGRTPSTEPITLSTVAATNSPNQDYNEHNMASILTVNPRNDPIRIPTHTSPQHLAHSPTDTSSTVIISQHGDDDNEDAASGSSDEPIILDPDNISTDEDDEDTHLDFWGGSGGSGGGRTISSGWISPPTWMSPRFLAKRMEREGEGDGQDLDIEDEGESSEEDESMDEDDEDEDENAPEIVEMELFGHR